MVVLPETMETRRRIILGAIGWVSFSACGARSAEPQTDGIALLGAVIDSPYGKILNIERNCRLSAGERYFSDAAPDRHSAMLTISSSLTIDGGGHLISCSTPDKSVIQIYDGAVPVTRVIIKNLRLQQEDSATLGDGKNHGLTDDYFALRFNGTSYCQAENIIIESCSLGVTFQFNQYAKPNTPASRASRYNRSNKVTIKRCTYMGLQLGGESNGVHINYQMTGVSKNGGGRAGTHGIRLFGFNNRSVQAVCQGNKVTGHVINGFTNALSIQEWARSNVIEISSRNCLNGVSIPRQKAYYSSAGGAAVPQRNHVTIDHTGGEFGIFSDGGSHNQFDVRIGGTSQRAIYERAAGGVPGVSTGNIYQGTITKPGKRGADLGGDDTTIDLDIAGNDVSTTNFGCIVSGTGARGRITARNCGTGVQLTGTNAILSVEVKACTNALVITGSDNTLNCDIDGDVIITGNNNHLSGVIRGRVTIASHAVGNDIRVSTI